METKRKEVRAMSNFDAGEKLTVEFGKKQIISQKEVAKTKWDGASDRFVPVIGEDGVPKTDIETRIKLPSSSEYYGYVFTIKEALTTPHKYKIEDGDVVDLGENDNMRAFSLYSNVEYKITRTPYELNADGYVAKDESGRNMLDFSRQEIVKISGKELKAEMDSWRTANRDARKEAGQPQKKEPSKEAEIA